jgi:murein DD-endopeptidase MepM/ murein hydrolase activator NlpD
MRRATCFSNTSISNRICRLGLLALWLLGLVACRAETPTPALTTSVPAEEAVLVSPSPTLEASPSSTPTLVVLADSSPLSTTLDVPVSTVAPDPLRFVFPTPGAAPISAWRPPLYPTPWAPTAYDHFYFARPIAADEVNWPVADYRYGGEFFANVVHSGVDFPAPKDTPVLAAGSGEVAWAGYGVYRGGYDVTDPYGLAVVIRHDFGYQGQPLYTIYGHLDRIDVATGQYVTTGETIGLVGETGRVTGPHLHFEVRVGENSFFATRNPELWLAPPIDWGVLAGRVLNSSGELVQAQLVIVHSNLDGQNWFARSYGEGATISDPYYQENVVVGDLPAGSYELRTAYAGQNFSIEVDIRPGVVTYFVFDGFDGFQLTTPPAPETELTPQPWESTGEEP